MSEQTQNEQPEAVNEADVEIEQGGEPLKDNDVEALKAQLESAEAKVAEHRDAVVRAQAEMENIRRRAERDVQSAHKYALEGFIESLLPVIDSLEQGLAQPANDDESKALKEGMELTLKMLIDTLEKKNVQQLNPVGQPFNPENHEAMAMQENPDFEPNAVIAVFQKGYTLNGRLVRPARVVVNKAKAVNVDEKA